MPRTLNRNDLIEIGEIARRTGLSVSAIRFYEGKGLIEPVRTSGNQRRFLRSDIRRVSFILIAQQLGLSLGEIDALMASLPHGRTPTARDWRSISRSIRARIEERIADLERTRDALDARAPVRRRDRAGARNERAWRTAALTRPSCRSCIPAQQRRRLET